MTHDLGSVDFWLGAAAGALKLLSEKDQRRVWLAATDRLIEMVRMATEALVRRQGERDHIRSFVHWARGLAAGILKDNITPQQRNAFIRDVYEKKAPRLHDGVERDILNYHRRAMIIMLNEVAVRQVGFNLAEYYISLVSGCARHTGEVYVRCVHNNTPDISDNEYGRMANIYAARELREVWQHAMRLAAPAPV